VRSLRRRLGIRSGDASWLKWAARSHAPGSFCVAAVRRDRKSNSFWSSRYPCQEDRVRKSLGRWFNRILSFPVRALLQRLSKSLPQATYGNIQLFVASESLTSRATEFFARTSEALAIASTRAPAAYSALQTDIRRIILNTADSRAPAYHRFQLAAIASPAIVFGSEPLAYAAWLLHVSGLSQGELESDRRADELLMMLDRGERARVEEWLNKEVR
jgi:hypothetical protein